MQGWRAGGRTPFGDVASGVRIARHAFIAGAAALALALMPGAIGAQGGVPVATGEFSGPNPWPAIRKERIARLLPAAMRDVNVQAWVTFLRENANDPLALHVGGENAGAPSAALFIATDDGVRDGLSYTQRVAIERALGPALGARLVPSHDLIQSWLAIKLPAEVAIMRRAAALTARLEEEAYTTVVPGRTRDSDLALFLKRRMRELGVEDGWSPAQNPSVNSGPDRGHSHASDRVIRHGDVIQTDFGIKVHGVWVTDIQRFAYVLRPGETAPPADVQRKWERGRDGGRAAFDAMRPGVTGAQVDSAQRMLMNAAGSASVPWGTGHGVGYWVHDAGPGLNRRETRTLREGMTFAFDGFFAWTLPGGDGVWGNGSKTVSVEEMAVITTTGAEYLVPPQQQLILIRAK